MPRWIPEPFWEGQDVYLIGGGPSLLKFDWDRIRGKCTIGCNSAYQLGKDICQIVFFGDGSFWKEHNKNLFRFQGLVTTNCRTLQCGAPDWLFVMERRTEGVYQDIPGWYGNSGACVVNLALILGAKRVLLLGYDMKIQDNRTNWYRDGVKTQAPYKRFLESFRRMAVKIREVFPDQEVINVNDDSDLKAFPTVPVHEFFQEETACV
jgi:hypothetical protein